VKRLARESFRLHRSRLPCIDIVLSPGRDVRKGDRATLRADLDALFNRLLGCVLAAPQVLHTSHEVHAPGTAREENL